jgi:hypothetical protein
MEADIMKAIISLLLLLPLAAACASGPGKAELDAEVKRLCAIDGGVRVYETVRLPADKFDERQQFINFYKPIQEENALGPEYLFKRDQHYYRQGNPEMSRIHYQIFRRSDGKLLGETVLYGRGGGDLPGPWHGSSFACPTYAEAGINVLLQKLFIQSDDKE